MIAMLEIRSGPLFPPCISTLILIGIASTSAFVGSDSKYGVLAYFHPAPSHYMCRNFRYYL